MAPPPAKKQKRIRISKKEREAFEREQEEAEGSEEEEGSEDEWANDRANASNGVSGQYQQDSDEEEEEEDDNGGVAQFLSDEGEDFNDSDEDEEAHLNKQLAAIPFASLLKAKKKLSLASSKASTSKLNQYGEEDEDQEDTSQSKINSRNNRQLLNAATGSNSARPVQNKRANGSLMKADRSSKHAPMEMSSKRAVGRSRAIVETRANKSRDPRFDSLSGAFKPDLFSNSYSFLDKARAAELEDVKRTAVLARKSAVLNEEEKEAIENTLVKLQSKEVALRTKAREGEAMREWKKEENKKRSEGKKEFYLKKSDQKAVILKAKFETLSKDKKSLRKAVEKKRRKTDQKDKKNLPEKRKRVE